METYVITGAMAAEFKKFLHGRIEYKYVKGVRSLPGPDKVSVNAIKHIVTERYIPNGRTIEEVSNLRGVVRARHIAMYLLRELTHMSYPEIARHFGDKHHTTVMHGVAQVRREINIDPVFSIEMSDLERELKG